MAATRSALAACGIVFVLLTGCSSGSDDGKSQASPTPTSAPSTTVRPVDTSFTGQNSAQFCALSKTYTDRFTNVGPGSTPAQLRTATQEGRTAINQAAAAAPSEIKPDVQVIANVFTGLFTELEMVDFDISKLSPASLGSLQAPEFQSSTTRFQAYLRTVCGVGG